MAAITFASAVEAGFLAADARRRSEKRQFQNPADRALAQTTTSRLLLRVPMLDRGFAGTVFTKALAESLGLTVQEVLASGNRVSGYPAPADPIARAA